MCVYRLLAVYSVFFLHYFVLAGVLFLARERELKEHVSLIFRLKMYGSVVLDALGCF
jgi:hypothetical protein